MEILKNAFVASVSEALAMFGLETVYDSETTSERMESASQVNILIGLTIGAGGSILLGMEKPMAMKMASTMMCGMEVLELDAISKSALGELMNMIMGNFLNKIQSVDNLVDITPPSIITGDRVRILLNKVETHRLMFHMGEHKYHITFSIQR